MKTIQYFFRILLLVTLICNSDILKAQTNSEMQLKEFFDNKVYSVAGIPNLIIGNFPAPNISTLTTNFRNTTGADDMAEVLAPVMDAQLELYETTKDKGYLINFINDALQMVSMRADYLNTKTI